MVYSGLRLRVRSQDENGSLVGEWFEVSYALILTLFIRLVVLKHLCEAHVVLG